MANPPAAHVARKRGLLHQPHGVRDESFTGDDRACASRLHLRRWRRLGMAQPASRCGVLGRWRRMALHLGTEADQAGYSTTAIAKRNAPDSPHIRNTPNFVSGTGALS